MRKEEGLKVIFIYTTLLLVVFFIFPKKAITETNQILPGDIIITEIMANPKIINDTTGEWFELYNRTENEIDLSNCEVTDNGTNKFTISQLIVPNQSYVLLARSNNPDENGGLIPDYIYNNYTLTNTEDAIIITCQETEIDRVEYSSTLGFIIPDGSSFFLKDLLLDNNSGDNWCEATSIYGDGDKGTPKFTNDDCGSINNNNPSVTSNNNPPVAEAGPNKNGLVEQTIHFDASESYDPDGDALKYSWDFGDGQKATGKTVSHVYQQKNIYLVTLTVDDGKISQTDSLTVTITELPLDNFVGKLIISELMPNPAGPDDDEWIELYNRTNTSLNLSGLILFDASNKKYIFSNNDFASLIIPAQGYFLVPRAISKISLNNTPPETITITAANKEIINQVTYTETAKEGWSLIFYDDEYYWTQTPTPGFSNILNLPTEDTITNQENGTEVNNTSDNELSNLSQNCQPAKKNQIILNELLPSPQGDDRLFEFIEIKNISLQPANLCGWSISDPTKQYFFSDDVTILPQNFFVLESAISRLSLNNNGDQISLYDASDELVDFIAYGRSEVDWSWSRTIDNEWFWTKNITPHEENIFSINNKTITEQPLIAKSENSNNDYQYVPLEEINQTAINDRVIVTGIVTVPPGKLGSQIMYVMNLSGLQIYQHFKNWPDLTVGDRVEIRGVISFPAGQPRLKVQTPEDITILEKNQINKIVMPIVSTDELSEEIIGSLVSLVGTAVEVKKNSLLLADDQGEINLVIKPSTEIKLPPIKEGDILEAIGIIDKTTAGWRLLPRYNEDIKIIEVQGFATAAPILANDKINTAKTNNYKFINYLYLTLIAIIILLSGLIYKLKKQQYGYTNH